MTWNHFTAVGEVVKGKVWIATKSRKTHVNSARDFADCTTVECTKINILYLSKEDVEANKLLLDARFSRALEITGIQSYHMFLRADESHIYAYQTAVSKEIKIKVLRESLVRRRFRFSEVYSSDTSDEEQATTLYQPALHEEKTVPEDIEEDWVVVIYDDWYPGK